MAGGPSSALGRTGVYAGARAWRLLQLGSNTRRRR
jgi:hypothetical protein